ncbi:hypothetical protein C8R46DRAFT_1031582 [Mycena filopes]|nr:hypothetical protein C8R46DRAFT_1031582 [Mycena filopes]
MTLQVLRKNRKSQITAQATPLNPNYGLYPMTETSTRASIYADSDGSFLSVPLKLGDVLVWHAETYGAGKIQLCNSESLLPTATTSVEGALEVFLFNFDQLETRFRSWNLAALYSNTTPQRDEWNDILQHLSFPQSTDMRFSLSSTVLYVFFTLKASAVFALPLEERGLLSLGGSNNVGGTGGDAFGGFGGVGGGNAGFTGPGGNGNKGGAGGGAQAGNGGLGGGNAAGVISVGGNKNNGGAGGVALGGDGGQGGGNGGLLSGSGGNHNSGGDGGVAIGGNGGNAGGNAS